MTETGFAGRQELLRQWWEEVLRHLQPEVARGTIHRYQESKAGEISESDKQLLEEFLKKLDEE